MMTGRDLEFSAGKNTDSEGSIRISLLQKEDASAAAELERAYYSLPWTERAFLDALDRDYYLFLKAETEGVFVGCCGCMRSFETGEITNVTVRQAYRRQGIARRMLMALMELGRREGIERFTLEVRCSNEGAIALYHSLGFRTEGVRKGYYESPREDALILWTPQPSGEKKMTH